MSEKKHQGGRAPAATKDREKDRNDRAADESRKREDAKVEEASEESFPASDPPGYSDGHS